MSQTGVFKGVNKGIPVHTVLAKVIKQFPNQGLLNALFLQFCCFRIDLQESKRVKIIIREMGLLNSIFTSEDNRGKIV